MREYTIGGEKYYVSNDSLYQTRDETHGVEDIDDHPIHLFGGDEHREYLVRLEWGGDVFSSVKVVGIDDRGPPSYYIPVDDFGSATPVDMVVPDGLNTCPECGSCAGDSDDEVCCLNCGYREEETEA